MKNYGLLLIVLLQLGCIDKEEMNPCDASPPNSNVSKNGRLTYTATAEKGFVTSVTYQTPGGEVTVSINSNHFQASFPVNEGDKIAIVAHGSISKGGKVTAGYSFLDAQGSDPVVTQASCAN